MTHKTPLYLILVHFPQLLTAGLLAASHGQTQDVCGSSDAWTPQVQKVKGPAPSSEHAQRGLYVTARSARETTGSGSVSGPYPPQGSAPDRVPKTWASGPSPADTASAPVLGPGPLTPRAGGTVTRHGDRWVCVGV